MLGVWRGLRSHLGAERKPRACGSRRGGLTREGGVQARRRGALCGGGVDSLIGLRCAFRHRADATGYVVEDFGRPPRRLTVISIALGHFATRGHPKMPPSAGSRSEHSHHSGYDDDETLMLERAMDKADRASNRLEVRHRRIPASDGRTRTR